MSKVPVGQDGNTLPAGAQPALSFVIIEYHCPDDLPPAIAAIRAFCRDTAHEIIISSNSLYPESRQRELIQSTSGVSWIFNPTNGGFASGMNAGIRAAHGALIVLINPDARLAEGSPSGLEAWFRDHPRVGLIGPAIITPGGVQTDSARRFMSLPRFILRQIRRLVTRRSMLAESGVNIASESPVDWVIGGCMVIRREALDTVGLLDEGYFLYVEDMDWCKRFWDAGYEVWYVPAIRVAFAADHKSTAGLTAGGRPNRYTWIHFKSYLRFLRKFGFFPSRPSLGN